MPTSIGHIYGGQKVVGHLTQIIVQKSAVGRWVFVSQADIANNVYFSIQERFFKSSMERLIMLIMNHWCSQNLGDTTSIISILWMRKLRHREFKWLNKMPQKLSSRSGIFNWAKFGSIVWAFSLCKTLPLWEGEKKSEGVLHSTLSSS